MLVVQDAYNASDLPHGGVGTIGNFDGVHQGQREVLDRVVARAREQGGTSMVLTFDPHPLAILRPQECPPLITTADQKERFLEELGIDALLLLRFDQEFSRVSADHFVRDFLHRRLGLQEVYVGASFTFGHDREGHVALLQDLGEELGFRAIGIDEVVAQGERVSSTRIRRAIAEGRVEAAQEMLSRPYSITGVITRGDRMGKRLGWPTINLSVENELLPADGVYACEVRFPGLGGTFLCATNIGTRPTVYENYQRVVEAHVLDFNTDVYGENVELYFFKRLREERIFPTVMDLSTQIRKDVDATREFFAAQRGLAMQVESFFKR